MEEKGRRLSPTFSAHPPPSRLGKVLPTTPAEKAQRSGEEALSVKYGKKE